MDESVFDEKKVRITSIYWQTQSNSSDPVQYEHVTGIFFIVRAFFSRILKVCLIFTKQSWIAVSEYHPQPFSKLTVRLHLFYIQPLVCFILFRDTKKFR